MRRIFILAIALWSLPVGAQTWSLQRCIDHAIEHSISLHQQEIGVEQKSIELSTAKASRLPGVSAAASENLSFGRGLTQDNTYSNTNTTSTIFSLGADLNIFRGFQVNNTIARSKLDLEAATADLEKLRNDIRTSVAGAYVQVLYNREVVNVARMQVRQDSLQLVRMASMLEKGKASKADYARQKASFAQSGSTLVQARGQLALAMLDLTQLLELPSPEGFEIEEPSLEDIDVLLPSPESIYAGAIGIRPEIAAEKLRLEGAEKGIKLAQGQRYPSLSLSGGVGSNFYTASNGMATAGFFSQLSNNFSQYVGLNLSIPIFSRLSVRNSVRQARLSRDMQSLQVEAAQKSLYKEIQQAYYNALSADAKYRSAMGTLDAAEESFNLVREKYENGLSTITEYNEAKTEYMRAASDVAQSRWEYAYQSRLLLFYRDGRISL